MVDFSCSIILDREKEVPLENTGTNIYEAPEKSLRNIGSPWKADIYSLGMTILSLYNGKVAEPDILLPKIKHLEKLTNFVRNALFKRQVSDDIKEYRDRFPQLFMKYFGEFLEYLNRYGIQNKGSIPDKFIKGIPLKSFRSSSNDQTRTYEEKQREINPSGRISEAQLSTKPADHKKEHKSKEEKSIGTGKKVLPDRSVVEVINKLGFKLTQKMGEGNFASVYLAFKWEDRNFYAIKYLKDLKHQEREKQILQRIKQSSDPRLVKIDNLEEEELMIMEAGLGTLRDYDNFCKDELGSEWREPVLLGLLAQLVEQVEALSRISIYHCDIKPDNIIISKDGRLKLIDFNLSALGSLPQGALRGTPIYMAPEVHALINVKSKLRKPYDPYKADLYSVAMTILELATSHNEIKTDPEAAMNSISTKYPILFEKLRDLRKERRVSDLETYGEEATKYLSSNQTSFLNYQITQELDNLQGENLEILNGSEKWLKEQLADLNIKSSLKELYHRKLAEVFIKKGQFEDAIGQIDQALRISKDFTNFERERAYCLGLLATAEIQRKDSFTPEEERKIVNYLDEAAAILEKYRKVSKLLAIENERGQLYTKLKKYDLAMSFFEKVIQHDSDPNSIVKGICHHDKGYLLSLQGRHKEARASYIKALKILQKNYIYGHPVLAKIYRYLSEEPKNQDFAKILKNAMQAYKISYEWYGKDSPQALDYLKFLQNLIRDEINRLEYTNKPHRNLSSEYLSTKSETFAGAVTILPSFTEPSTNIESYQSYQEEYKAMLPAKQEETSGQAHSMTFYNDEEEELKNYLRALRYTPVALIKEGEFARVFGVWSEKEHKYYAWKYFKQKTIENEENKILDKIYEKNDPNLVKIKKEQCPKQTLYLTEYGIGDLHDLERCLKVEWPQRTLEGLVAELSKQVDLLREMGIYHRDIKPDNVIITPTGQVKLVDFSISVFGDDINQIKISNKELRAPEEKHDLYKTDIYSVAVTVLRMAVGKGFEAEKINTYLKNPNEKYEKLFDLINEIIESREIPARLSKYSDDLTKFLLENKASLIAKQRFKLNIDSKEFRDNRRIQDWVEKKINEYSETDSQLFFKLMKAKLEIENSQYDSALSILEEIKEAPLQLPDKAKCYSYMGLAYERMGASLTENETRKKIELTDEAITHYKTAQNYYLSCKLENEALEMSYNMANILFQREEYESALEEFTKLEKSIASTYIGLAKWKIAQILRKKGDLENAGSKYETARNLLEEVYLCYHPELFTFYKDLIEFNFERDRVEEGVAVSSKAYIILEDWFGKSSPETKNFLKMLIQHLTNKLDSLSKSDSEEKERVSQQIKQIQSLAHT